jgi:hypothetical protein
MTMNEVKRRSPSPQRTPKPTVAGNVLLAVSALGASAQSTQLETNMRGLGAYYAIPATRTPEGQRERFDRLAAEWRAATTWTSSTTEAAMHPAYQAIIGMGQSALPLILQDLRDNSGHWYWALKAISNEDPVPPCDRGSIKRMRAHWLKWGEAKGYLLS